MKAEICYLYHMNKGKYHSVWHCAGNQPRQKLNEK